MDGFCSACGHGLLAGGRFCPGCGTAVSTGCSSCGGELVAGAAFCPHCGSQVTGAAPAAAAGAVIQPVSPVAARRITSVLFGDLVAFTTLSESRDQEDMRELLSAYFEKCRQIVARYGGVVEKFIGDAVMAVWGVPTAHEDDAERAVRAGLELVNAVAELGADVGVPDLAMRIGIVTGEVAVTIGAEHQGMVAGDAVNTASRVQSVATAGQVWVDETTRLLTSSAISYLDVGSHQLKGKADPVPLWSVRAVVAAVGGAQRADGLEAPLVGREREMRLVKEAFHGVEESGRAGMLVVSADPGVGKSRVGWEFFKYVDGLRRQVAWHSGRCVAYGEGLAFYALAEAVRARLRALAADPSVDRDDQDVLDPALLLDRGLARLPIGEDERSWLLPRLGVLLGVGSLGGFPREDLFAAWTVFLERVSGGDPVVLLIDDAQNADAGLLQFVEHLLTVARFPCFVLLLSRPGLLEGNPTLATNPRATIRHLEAMTDTDVAALLDGLVVGLPESLRDALVARSEGVPLFAVETVRSLIDRDLVVPRGGRYVLADPASVDVDAIGAPASLQALIAARLDALEPDQRHLVDRASVIGMSFTREELAELCPDLDVDAILVVLVRLQIFTRLTSRLSAEFGQFQFVQSVVRQVAYSTLSRRDRRALHLLVARQTEAVEDAAGEMAPVVAQHYLEAIEAMPGADDVADLRAHASAQLERAAERARALGAPVESAGHLLAALELATSDEDRSRLESAAAWAFVDGGRYEEAIEHAVTATEAFDRLGDPIAAGRAAAAHGLALVRGGDNAAAIEVAAPRWEALLGRPGAELALLKLGTPLRTAALRIQEEPRRDVADEMLRIAERIDAPEDLAEAVTQLALDYSIRGSSTIGRALLAASVELSRKNHFPMALARSLSNLTVEYKLDDLARAIECGREAVEVATRSGLAPIIAYTDINLSLAQLEAGEWNALEERDDLGSGQLADVTGWAGISAYLHAAQGVRYEIAWPGGTAPASDDPADASWIATAESLAAWSRGDGETALQHGVEGVNLQYQLQGVTDDLVHMWPHAVEVAMSVGDARTRDRLIALLDEAASQQRLPISLQAHRARVAALLVGDDERERVEPLMREAIDGFRTWGARPYQSRAEAELGLWLNSSGRAEEGAALTTPAQAYLTELGANGWLAQLVPSAAR